MRVPGISSTAGYAAQTHCESFLNEQFYTGLPSTVDLNKNNGNIPLTTQQISLENTNNFVSSADEFVKRALSSVPTSYEVESNLVFLQTCNENKNFNKNIKQSPAEQFSTNTHEESNQYNTYRSFKDAFIINKTFYEECAKNLNTLNTHDVEDDIDPILVINTPYPDDICKHPTTSANKNMKTSAEEEQSFKEKLEQHKISDFEEVAPLQDNKKDTDLFNDNDYDDQTMLDLCEHRDDEEVNEIIDREAYLTSPTSSSISDHTPKRTFSYFPRGIINPNYPGFQHLAHTLSEHFITGTSQSDSYDSEMSDYEMELSADSFEDLSVEANEKFNLKLNKYNNNIESQQSSVFKKMHPDELLENQENVCHAYNGDDNCNIDIRDLPISLKTTLTLLEPADRMPTPCETPEPTEMNEYLSESKTKYFITPPDILMKDDNLHVTTQFLKKENRPDLLHGVSPHHVGNISKIQCTIQNTTLTIDQMHGVLELPAKDEMSLGVTPVDIIGDFGQEVEREFGLLVSGYRRLMDGSMDSNENDGEMENGSISKHAEHLADAILSNANDEIDADKYLAALQHINDDNLKELESTYDIEKPTIKSNTTCDFTEDNNAVDWSLPAGVEEQTVQVQHTEVLKSDQIVNVETSNTCTNDEINMEVEIKSIDANLKKPKYQKASYDERQLPPVAIEYKRCQQSQRKARNSQHSEKNAKPVKKPSFTNRFLHGKRGVFKTTEQANNTSRKREEAEIHQYQQLINDKELILSNSRYTKLSSWAQYLKNSVKDRSAQNSTELISPSALELFDAYKVGGEVDKETLQKHLKMAKEIEKKRRSDREEIRRRLAMGDEENANNIAEQQKIPKPTIQSALHNGLYLCRLNDASSDTESHSSDSETCPKLSKIRQQGNLGPISSSTNEHTSTHPYYGRPLSVSCTNKQLQQQQQKEKEKHLQQQEKQQKELLPISDEDKECDFFTKQARLQIEARMALAQAKKMAHMHMEFERQNRRMSPITGIIRNSLDKIGVQMSMDKRRVSRQMLTDMNIAQLQILVNSLHTHIENLNESLVQFLMERDDLHVGQDAMLADIEELTRFIGAQEHLSHQHKKATKCNRSK